MDGVLLLDKPAGPSSNQALQKVRHLFQARKAGHTGTLDPFATGMLPICLGEATKTAAFMLDARKAYRAEALFGAATATGDPEGEVVERAPVPDLEEAELEAAMAPLRGESDQLPPMYSALKHEGRPLYEWARRGIEIERKPRRVRIDRLVCLEWQSPRLVFEVVCSKGTYIRTLAEDLARALGTVAHLAALRRLWVEPFEEARCWTLEALREAAEEDRLAETLLPPDAGLAGWPVQALAEPESRRFTHGNPVPAPPGAAGWQRVRDREGRLLGLAEAVDGLLHPRRVMASPESRAEEEGGDG